MDDAARNLYAEYGIAIHENKILRQALAERDQQIQGLKNKIDELSEKPKNGSNKKQPNKKG